MPMAGGSNLYDIFDHPSHISLTNENHLVEGDGEMNLDGGASLNASSAFDTMLEMLPDTTDFSFFTSKNGDGTPQEELNGESRRSSGKGSLFADQIDQLRQTTSQQLNSGFASLLNGTTTIKGTNVNASASQPIEIANQQNGEITQLWDFNVDDFMMTPEGSNSATISAPNSFNSEGQFQPSSTPGVPLMAISSHNPHNDHFDHSMSVGNNFSQFLTMGIPFPNQASATLFNRSASSSPRNASQTTLKKEDVTGLYRPPLNGRRSSTQLSKSVHAEDGGIFLSSTNVANSVRKNSLGRQISSTSLSSYKRGPSSTIPEIQKKPALLCFNCKTQKTPLWRRDSNGNTLCNACGLFQKLHGTMRPLSLKTDVIKKRNNRKRAKKLQEQAEKNADSNDSKRNQIGNDKKNMNGSNTTGATSQAKNVRLRKKTSLPSNINTMASESTLPSGETPTSMNFNDGRYDLRMSYNQAGVAYPSNNSESLNSNNLITHNKKTSNPSMARKPRRDSTSSSNSCSSKSSSRSVVPILPKPSTSGGNQSFNMNLNTSTSAGNSAASSPRVGSNFNPTSPMTSSQNGFSSSTGRQAITIPRRKLSRNHSSSSSSFMAASLQQLQQQNQQQQQQTQQQTQPQTFNTSLSQSSNWNLPPTTASPITARSPKTGFDLFNSPSNSPGVPSGKKSQTSLLSEQLQNSNSSQTSQKLDVSEITTNGYHPSPMANSPQSLSLKRSSVAASPRNSYADSVMQHRGLHDSNLTLRRQSSLGLRRNAHSKDQILSPSTEMAGGSAHTSTVTTPTLSTTTTPVTATTANGSNTPGLHSNISDELDWLKFGM